MCGLTGFIDTRAQTDADRLQTVVRTMTERLAHRGPDDAGYWTDPPAGVALGHRRLAIIDLSPEGRQPMISSSGRYVMIYNGEIYNFMELRAELEQTGHAFRGRSDTEVLLAAVEEWGLETAVKRSVGMFALAVWDRAERRLHLVRDRVGIKPLYYGWMGDLFLFGSELKPLRAHPGFDGRIDRDVVALYLRHNYVPSPYSIFRGVYSLRPGAMLTVDPAGGRPPDFSPWPEEGGDGVGRPRTYWSAARVYERGAKDPFDGTETEAADLLERTLTEAVRCRMVADVPLGAFLSGGVDSSVVAALMQSVSDRPVKTFTVGFDQAEYDEAPFARDVARHLGADHTELYVTGDEALEVIPRLPHLYDEPFSDSSQIPTFLISRLTRRHVTVSLSGDGGDELFGGYNRYFEAPRLWNACRRWPAPFRRGVRRAMYSVPISAWDRGFRWARPLLPARLQDRHIGDTVYKVADVFGSASQGEIYRQLISHFDHPDRAAPGAVEPPTALTRPEDAARGLDPVRTMMYQDLISYHPDDILVKVDRASMGVGLEARVPLIDHRVVEMAARLPLGFLIQGGQGKQPLRRVLDRHVPRRLIERPKKGFGVPLHLWLRGPLRPWAEDLLAPGRLDREGFFDTKLVRRMWNDHLSGRRDWKYHLWDFLMFQAWLDTL